MEDSKIVIYKGKNGVQVDVKLEKDTIWLNQQQIANVFGVRIPAINKHIKNIYSEGELQKTATVSKMEIVQTEGSRQISRKMDFYNLDMILSVGYRVNSKNATAFRIWATNIFKKYITDGYVINEKRISANNIKMLIQTVDLLRRTTNNQIENLDPMIKELLSITAQFADGFEVLDNYDHEQLEAVGRTKRKSVKITDKELLKEIKKMSTQFGGLFGIPKDESFASSIGQIYQSFEGKDLYPTLEEKAATLLYLVTKNHSFVDGNKRIAAFCFLYFMAKNKMPYKNIINDAALVALILLVAESKPSEMDTIKKVTITILNNGEKK